jgi:hypothetical protein
MVLKGQWLILRSQPSSVDGYMLSNLYLFVIHPSRVNLLLSGNSQLILSLINDEAFIQGFHKDLYRENCRSDGSLAPAVRSYFVETSLSRRA